MSRGMSETLLYFEILICLPQMLHGALLAIEGHTANQMKWQPWKTEKGHMKNDEKSFPVAAETQNAVSLFTVKAVHIITRC